MDVRIMGRRLFYPNLKEEENCASRPNDEQIEVCRGLADDGKRLGLSESALDVVLGALILGEKFLYSYKKGGGWGGWGSRSRRIGG